MHTENLWAPWRWDYIQQLDATRTPPASNPQDTSSQGSQTSAASGGGSACFLCQAGQTDINTPQAADRLVLFRDHRGVLLLNRFPYANGHLMAAPLAHSADLTDLTPDQRNGLMDLLVLGQRLLAAAVNPQGFNIGMNIGRSAGAGVPGHLHIHIVPRWAGDTNFMQVVGHIRVIPQALDHSYQQLTQTLNMLLQNDR